MLVPCTPAAVPGRVLDVKPGITVLEDVVYRPLRDAAVDQDLEWGIYDRQGRLARAAAYMRGPELHLVGQSPAVDAAVPAASADTFIYGGVFFEHFGHFILSTLSRLWPFAEPGLRARLGSYPILFHAPFEPPEWFAQPHIAELLGGLDLPASRFVRLREPTRIRRLIVPGLSHVEMSHMHPAFVDMTRAIGRRLRGGASLDRGGPVYLSRTRLPVGTQGWCNEEELEAVLRRFGVEIVYPETRSVTDEIRLFSGRPVVAGTVASAFYVAPFCETPAPMVMLSPSPVVYTGFTMIDEAAGQSTRYFHVDSEHLGIDMSQRLWSTFRLRDPVATGAALLGAMRDLIRA